jgi:succinate dehydrogenase/fumarate reductase flavoprotein subunit
MGGLWVDYELMTTVPGLFALGEANFADHGANRLGAKLCRLSRRIFHCSLYHCQLSG